MKKGIIALLLAWSTTAYAQQYTTTPNIGLEIPAVNTPNWQVSLDYDLNKLDSVIWQLQSNGQTVSSASIAAALGYTPVNPANAGSEYIPVASQFAQNLNLLTASAFQGAWSSASTYSKGQMVSYNGNVYVSLINDNSNDEPDTATADWSLFVQAGASSGSTATDDTSLFLFSDATCVAATFFGASPTASGSANVTAINAAVAAAQSGQTSNVCLSGGIYPLASTVTIPTGIKLIGRGSVGSTGTTLQASSGFSSGTSIVTFGSSAVDARVENMTLDCNSQSGVIGMKDSTGLQGTGANHLSINNCNSNSLEVLGAGASGGAAEYGAGYHDLIIAPGTTVTTSTVPLLVKNLVGSGGFSNISINMTSGHATNYAAEFSGENYKIDGIETQYSGTTSNGSVLLGGSGTMGAVGLSLSNVIAGTGSAGPVVEIGTGGTSTPSGIIIKNAIGGSGTIKNDVLSTSITSPSYSIGASGEVLDLGSGNAWSLTNAITNNGSVVLQGTGTQLELQNGTSGSSGYPFKVDTSTNLTIGGHNSGDTHWINNGTFGKFCLDANGTCDSLIFDPSMSDTGNAFLDMIADDVWWNHSSESYSVTGNGSHEIYGIGNVNPTATNTPNSSGGIAIFAANSITEPSTFSQTQMNSYIRALIPSQGGIEILNGNNAACVAGTLTFVSDSEHQNDPGMKICTTVSGTPTWVTPGTGSGSGGGGASSSIAGVNVSSTTATNGQFLQVVSNQWQGSSVQTIESNAGMGISINSSGAPYQNVGIRVISTTTATIANSDCGNSVYFTSSAAVSAVLVQAGAAMTTGCIVRLVNAGSAAVTVSPNTSTIAGASSFSLAAGTPAAPTTALVGNDGTNYYILGH